jgi:hypothetical protein
LSTPNAKIRKQKLPSAIQKVKPRVAEQSQ